MFNDLLKNGLMDLDDLISNGFIDEAAAVMYREQQQSEKELGPNYGLEVQRRQTRKRTSPSQDGFDVVDTADNDGDQCWSERPGSPASTSNDGSDDVDDTMMPRADAETLVFEGDDDDMREQRRRANWRKKGNGEEEEAQTPPPTNTAAMTMSDDMVSLIAAEMSRLAVAANDDDDDGFIVGTNDGGDHQHFPHDSSVLSAAGLSEHDVSVEEAGSVFQPAWMSHLAPSSS